MMRHQRQERLVIHPLGGPHQHVDAGPVGPFEFARVERRLGVLVLERNRQFVARFVREQLREQFAPPPATAPLLAGADGCFFPAMARL